MSLFTLTTTARLCSELTLITLRCWASLILKTKMEVALTGAFSKMEGFLVRKLKEFTWEILFVVIWPAAIGSSLPSTQLKIWASQSVLPSFL
jgi:hypothetical protein